MTHTHRLLLARYNSDVDPMTFAPSLVIPHYQHLEGLRALLPRIDAVRTAQLSSAAPSIPAEWSCWLVDDGSPAEVQAELADMASSYPWVHLHCLPSNGGKGVATMRGFQLAADAGCTHALQIDADGQHDVTDIVSFMQAAQQLPNCIIAGTPIYDDSVPAARRYGRYLTRFWVWVNTLSLRIADPQCGYRMYPLKPTLAIINPLRVARRMDFDIDIIVRLYWAGMPVDNLPTKVIYPEAGVSHFDMLRDNVRISRCHTQLFFGMLWRLPRLLYQRLTGRSKQRLSE